MRTYPGGLSVSRAIGDLKSPAVTCEPECTRLSLPPGGARLIIASDGLWNAMSDEDAADTAAECDSAAGATQSLQVPITALQATSSAYLGHVTEPREKTPPESSNTPNRCIGPLEATSLEPVERSDSTPRNHPTYCSGGGRATAEGLCSARHPRRHHRAGR